MRTETQQELIDIIRFEIRGIPLPDGFLVSDEESLVKLSKKHDLSHLVYDALNKNDIGFSDSSVIQQYYAAIWRSEQMIHELKSMTELFEKEGIDFIPLKGAVMRDLYPESWMRTSADIDILLREDNFETACKMLTSELLYAEEQENTMQHLSFRSPANNVNIEVHRMLLTEYQADQNVIEQLPLVWEQARPYPGHEHFMQMSDPCFYFYHIAHMAKHLSRSGGCPIRSLIDLWILDKQPDRDESGRAELLKKGGLLTFGQVMSSTAKAWLEGGNVPSEELEQFILTGQLYRNSKNRVLLGIGSDGLAKFVLKRLFLPYDLLKYSYPVLQKHRWLTPFFQIVRWTKVFKRKYHGWLNARVKVYLHANHKEIDQLSHIKDILGIKNNDEE